MRVQMKSADMSTFISGFHSLYPAMAAFLVGAAAFAGEILILNALNDARPSSPSSPYGPFFKSDPGVITFVGTMAAISFIVIGLLLVVPVLSGAITQWFTKRIMSRTIAPIAWKFSEFKISAWNMRTRLKQFRKFMDTEYKKIAPN